MKRSQLDRVRFKLNRDGFITRNECLRNYISRLSAIILLLKRQGWKFETVEEKGDYKYIVIK
jgi:hypothetical protein